MRIIIIITVVLLSACSASQVQKVAKVSRILTGGDQSRSAFLDPTVNEALDHEMRICLDGNYKNIELLSKCTKIAVAKVRKQKGLDKEIDLGGTVIVEQMDDEEVIDNRDEEDKKESENDPR